MNTKGLEELERVTILKADYVIDTDCDDEDHIVLETDKGFFDIYSSFGNYSGNSKGEYPSYIIIRKRD